MIIGIGADKGSPGATITALLLGMCWPTDRVVVELDPRGADLTYRCTGPGGRPLAVTPSLMTVAIESRPGSAPRPLDGYAQPAGCAVPLIVGENSPTRFTRIAPHLPSLTRVLAGWAGTVIADLGSLQPASPTLTVARAASVVVLVTRADVTGLAQLRERAEELAVDLGDHDRPRSPLAVIVRAAGDDPRDAGQRAERLLASIGSPAPVIGVLPEEPKTIAALLTGQVTRRMTRGPLLTEALATTVRLCTGWPEVTAPDTSIVLSADSAVPVTSGWQM